MLTSLDRAQAKSSMQRIIIIARLLILGYRAMRTKERPCFNHGSHFGSVAGLCYGTREGKMSLGGDDRTKHDIKSSMRGSRNHTPSSKSFGTSESASRVENDFFVALP